MLALSVLFISVLGIVVYLSLQDSCGASPPDKLNQERVNVLWLGDSISKGMLEEVDLPADWQIFHPARTVNGGCRNTEHGMNCLSNWVGNHTWDIVIFNFGLHDLGLDYEHLPLETYSKNLESITKVLDNHSRRLYWVTNTPVPETPVSPPRTQSDVIRYNTAANGIMKSTNVKVVDMFYYVMQQCSPNETHYDSCKGFQLDKDVHYTRDGYRKMANYLVQQVRLDDE